jgi:hypothetical protein
LKEPLPDRVREKEGKGMEGKAGKGRDEMEGKEGKGRIVT